MRILLFFLIMILVAYCTLRSSKKDAPDIDVIRDYRIETAKKNLTKSTGKYVNDGETDVGFANNGIAPWQLATRIFNKYDQDKDGLLDVSGDSFLRTKSQGGSVEKTESRGLLFTYADKVGEKNGRVTIEELFAYISTFDEDGDGEITSTTSLYGKIMGYESEWENFERNHGERVKYVGN